ncbi:Sugar kinase of the NBD/HSP70 family, may contain an N-terminal HTH domain [Prosthecobacter debontii]|uniref:Sugar kinase of the NBD/HSP70 family, may contain an N-terminal HTH domain n=1 Tax=Prosthecobacter debontii TaxID=48467 RepID=A0A1T4WVT5_9BACT|nr:ROK family protein [Prosthecobacter debontii]SKA81426.1 Sugar kinase of the NBD/HSP70 family, may contain an N-terminal HTH domain [Prosthecobacter debontii]
MRTKPADQTQLLAAILLQLRGQHAVSRSGLAKLMGLSPSTVGIYVDHLTAMGYVHESGLEQGPMGRPQRRLHLNENVGWFCGVEFNAERVQAVRVDFAGQQRAAVARPLPHRVDTRTVLDEIARAVNDLSQIGSGEMLSLGFGVPGLVSPTEGIAVHYSFIPDWRRIPIVQDMRARFPGRVNITLENNLRAIALAERWFGGGRQLDDYVILGPRRGFGVAIMKNGQLVQGGHHAAGEIGRWPWPLDSRGAEVHDELSAPAVWRRLTHSAHHAPLPKDLHTAFQAFATDESEVWHEIATDFGRVMGLLHLLLDAKSYFLHGPLTALGERFCREIVRQTVRLNPALAQMQPTIVPSSLGDEAGALGAACLAMEAWVPDLSFTKISQPA